MNKKAKSFMAVLLAASMILSGCSIYDEKTDESGDKVEIVTTLYPLYEFAKAVGGEKISVKLLLPPGAEAHTFDPTPKNIVDIEKADLFISIGADMEPWADDILKGISNEKLTTLRASDFVELIGSSHEEEPEHEDDHDPHHGEMDPHIWLDFENDQKIVTAIAETLSEIDAENADFYMSNADSYSKKLIELDELYKKSLTNCEKNIFITGGHNAYAYMAQRYNLEYVAAHGISPDSEPTPQDMKNLIDISKNQNLKYILFEDLVSPKIAEAIAEETSGMGTLLFSPLANLTKEQFQNGETFISLMTRNLDSLKIALECK
ncbi:MAG: zinc ABC transporter substrate-binding protein [Candidatus Gracilibacteria bacterium]|nr:zinc ABC transporter substrate-binding protein [Candidatus Gracilibacteria bacterium]